MDRRFEDEELTKVIIEAIIKVHQTLGPGFNENVYRNALAVEFAARQMNFQMEHEISIFYAGKIVGKHRLDLIVEGKVILELKTVEELSRAHYAQVRSYLKSTKLPLAFLINFS